MMVGARVRAAEAIRLRAAFALLERSRDLDCSASSVMPLFRRHHILAQVAGDNMQVIKLLPPFVITEADIVWIGPRCGGRQRGPSAGRHLGYGPDAGSAGDEGASRVGLKNPRRTHDALRFPCGRRHASRLGGVTGHLKTGSGQSKMRRTRAAWPATAGVRGRAARPPALDPGFWIPNWTPGSTWDPPGSPA